MLIECVLDTSIILSLGTIGAFDVLWLHPHYQWLISGVVRSELTRRATKDPIDAAIAAGKLTTVELDTLDPLQVEAWLHWQEQVDVGEAEAIAVAITRGCLVAIEDRAAQRAIERECGKGRWVNSLSLLVDAVKQDRLTVTEADKIFAALDCYSGYFKRGVRSVLDV